MPALPVVQWLQAGAVAAGVGFALAAVPAVASADDVTRADAARSATAESGTTAASPRSTAATRSHPGPSAPRRSTVAQRPMSTVAQRPMPAAAQRPATAVDRTAPRAAARVAANVTSADASATAGTQADPFGQLAAFLGLPGAPATSAPSLGAFPILARLTVEDLLSGSGPAAVSNPTAVVTGLFNEVLRADPTAGELANYLGVLNFTGVNGVVAGLYSSTAFRQTQVANYYLELLGRTATSNELAWGTTELMWGMPEPLFAASIAGSRDFYQVSSSGGGTLGPDPTPTSFVNLLYRSMLGAVADPTALAGYVQQLQAGLPTALAAMQFVTADAYRAVKVAEVYQVLGQQPTAADIDRAVALWFWSGGQTGISTSLLATASNVTAIQTGQVVLPDVVAAAELEQLLLAAYTETADGFVKLYGSMVGNCSDTAGPDCKNPALYSLLTTGGTERGIPNSSLQLSSLTANVATLIPTQNEIDLQKSLKFPLQDPASLQTYFAGGTIQPFGNPLVTANGGTYIIDGHHRWSSIVLINPYTLVTALDLGYVPNPQDGLKEAQIGVAAAKGFLAVAPGGGINLYTTDQQTFDTAVRGYIENAADAHPGDPNPTVPWTDQVLAVFTTYLGLAGQSTEQKYTSIQNYLWGNVLRMRELNPYIPGATSREVMPQTDPLPVVQTYLASGALSYTFPTISYLG